VSDEARHHKYNKCHPAKQSIPTCTTKSSSVSPSLRKTLIAAGTGKQCAGRKEVYISKVDPAGCSFLQGALERRNCKDAHCAKQPQSWTSHAGRDTTPCERRVHWLNIPPGTVRLTWREGEGGWPDCGHPDPVCRPVDEPGAPQGGHLLLHLQHWVVVHIQELTGTSEAEAGCLQVEKGSSCRVSNRKVVVSEGTHLLLHD